MLTTLLISCSVTSPPAIHHLHLISHLRCNPKGREGERERGREGEREGGREEGKGEGGGREGGGREGGREGERGRKGGGGRISYC